MTFTYPAVFTKKDDDTYEGYFPDLEGCTFSGDTLDEALDDAIEAERDWVNAELEEAEGIGFPYVSHQEDLDLADNQFVRPIQVIVHPLEGWSD